ncbi:MAG: hypothetical protein IT393_03035 [Nitrospirae bacterium]|nr:hypothetical protein [Nitrospirota bacterium]
MIVFDASALILLARIEILELFLSNFQGKVLIPYSVKSEVLMKDKGGMPLIEELIRSKKIQVLSIKGGIRIEKVMSDFNIGKGEAEAICLALENDVSVVATDDRNAMRACKMLHLEFITAITVLIRAFEKGLIDRDEALIKLQRLSKISRYSRVIIEDAKKKMKGGD